MLFCFLAMWGKKQHSISLQVVPLVSLLSLPHDQLVDSVLTDTSNYTNRAEVLSKGLP